MTTPATTATLSTFTASDGENIAVHDWPVPEGLLPRGAVVLVHGLGEHAGRYDALAQRLNGWGFEVRGYDQSGHGVSAGAQGSLPSAARPTDDLADIIDSVRARQVARAPLLVLGHSLGGLIAACLVAQRQLAIDGLILSSPALNAGLSGVQRLLLATVARIAPDFRVGDGIKPQFLSHDSAVVAAYRSDSRVHDRISGRLARFIADGGPLVLSYAPRWKVPTLLMYAGDDHLVDAQGSRDFAAAAPPDVVTARCFDKLYHEIFNETEMTARPVFDCLKQWLDARF